MYEKINIMKKRPKNGTHNIFFPFFSRHIYPVDINNLEATFRQQDVECFGFPITDTYHTINSNLMPSIQKFSVERHWKIVNRQCFQIHFEFEVNLSLHNDVHHYSMKYIDRLHYSYAVNITVHVTCNFIICPVIIRQCNALANVI